MAQNNETIHVEHPLTSILAQSGPVHTLLQHLRHIQSTLGSLKRIHCVRVSLLSKSRLRKGRAGLGSNATGTLTTTYTSTTIPGLLITPRGAACRTKRYWKFARQPCHDEWIQACNGICCDSFGIPSLWANASDWDTRAWRFDRLKISFGGHRSNHGVQPGLGLQPKLALARQAGARLEGRGVTVLDDHPYHAPAHRHRQHATRQTPSSCSRSMQLPDDSSTISSGFVTHMLWTFWRQGVSRVRAASAVRNDSFDVVELIPLGPMQPGPAIPSVNGNRIPASS